jgi:hypothetical protein
MMGDKSMKKNCWEFKKCGRELGGEHAFKLGVCPAAIDVFLDSAHGGISAGRACWVVAGTMCGDTVQGTFALKYKSCARCNFYVYVKEAEGESLIPTVTLLKMLD